MIRAAEILGVVVKGRKKPHVVAYFRLLPKQAAALLGECNDDNRRWIPGWAETIARDLAAGNWRFDGSPVCFDTAGNLMDGQHRLKACVLTNKPITVSLCFNLPPEAKKNIDTGKPRNAATNLTFAGGYGAVSNFVLATLRGALAGGGATPKLSVDELGRLLRRHRPTINFVHEVMGTSGALPGLSTGITRGLLMRAAYSQDKEKVRHFGEVLISGNGNGNGDQAVIRYRNWLLSITRGRASANRGEIHRKGERALWAHLNNEAIGHLYEAKHELFPLPEEIEG